MVKGGGLESIGPAAGSPALLLVTDAAPMVTARAVRSEFARLPSTNADRQEPDLSNFLDNPGLSLEQDANPNLGPDARIESENQ